MYLSEAGSECLLFVLRLGYSVIVDSNLGWVIMSAHTQSFDYKVTYIYMYIWIFSRC